MTLIRRGWLLLTAALLTACASTPEYVSGPRTATIMPSGGTITASGVDGTVYVLTFPAGAVQAPIDVTLTPLSIEASRLAGFKVEPAGLLLALAVEVGVTLPDGVAAPSQAALAFDELPLRTFVPTEVAGGTLRTSLPYFAIPVDGWGAVPPAPLASSATAARIGVSQSDDESIVATVANCAERLESLQGSFDALLASNSYEAALRVAWNSAGLASLCRDDAQTEAFLEQMSVPACARYSDLVLLANVIAADTYDRFNELIQPIINWTTLLRQRGIECSEAQSLEEVIDSKYVQFLTFYAGAINGTSFTADFEQLVDEARKTFLLVGQSHTLALGDAAAMLRDQVLHELMDLLRDRAFTECVDTADHYPLSALLETSFLAERPSIGPISTASSAAAPSAVGAPPTGSPSPQGTIGRLGNVAVYDDADVQADLQHCASFLTLEVWADPDVPEEVVDARRELGPGATPGEWEIETSTTGPVEGYLVLRGPIEPFRCGIGRSIEDHEIIVRFANVEVERVSTLEGNPEIDVKASLEAAGRDPDGLNDVEILVRRSSGACGGLYGDAGSEVDLFTIDFTSDPVPRIDGAAVAPTSLTASESFNTFTFSMPWVDGGENLTTLHVSYDLAGVVQTDAIDLATSAQVSGFTGIGNTGQYQENLRVQCSEIGKTPIKVAFVLEDAFGQRSEERQVSIPVTYSGCPAATGAAAAPMHGLELGGWGR